MTRPTMALAAAALLSIGSLVGSVITQLGLSIMYDDSPAMQVRHPVLRVATLRPGEPVEYQFTYDKRVDCHPPLGSSTIQYRLWTFRPGELDHWQWLDYARPSRAAPGRNVMLDGYTRIPLPELPPGSYAVQFVAEYSCARASRDQTIEGPIIRFRVDI